MIEARKAEWYLDCISNSVETKLTLCRHRADMSVTLIVVMKKKGMVDAIEVSFN
jgi:hypothetical protein